MGKEEPKHTDQGNEPQGRVMRHPGAAPRLESDVPPVPPKSPAAPDTHSAGAVTQHEVRATYPVEETRLVYGGDPEPTSFTKNSYLRPRPVEARLTHHVPMADSALVKRSWSGSYEYHATPEEALANLLQEVMFHDRPKDLDCSAAITREQGRSPNEFALVYDPAAYIKRRLPPHKAEQPGDVYSEYRTRQRNLERASTSDRMDGEQQLRDIERFYDHLKPVLDAHGIEYDLASEYPKLKLYAQNHKIILQNGHCDPDAMDEHDLYSKLQGMYHELHNGRERENASHAKRLEVSKNPFSKKDFRYF